MSLKEQLGSGEPQYGLWLGLANAYTAEICAGSGADWLLVDGEHAPNTLTTVLGQLQAARGLVEVVARPPDHDATRIKQYLDLGVGTSWCPWSRRRSRPPKWWPRRATRRQALGEWRACSTARPISGRMRTISEWPTTRSACSCRSSRPPDLELVKEIALVPGVDGIFVGPAARQRRSAIWAIPDIQWCARLSTTCSRPPRPPACTPGFSASSPADGREWTMKGAALVAVGSDVGVLQRGTRKLFQEVRGYIVPNGW